MSEVMGRIDFDKKIIFENCEEYEFSKKVIYDVYDLK